MYWMMTVVEATTNKKYSRVWFQGLRATLRDAVLITAVSSTAGLLVNLVHPEAIPFIADREYEILVPCPEPGGEVIPLEAADSMLDDPEVLMVDARDPSKHADWRFRQAMSVPYDYLDPVPDATIKQLAKKIARSQARRVVVYGDGDVPDSGEQLSKEISTRGIKNVFFVRGGAPALKMHATPRSQGGGP